MLEVIMHLFDCVVCSAPMATSGRNRDGRCFYCSEVFRGVTDEKARAIVSETKRQANMKYKAGTSGKELCKVK